MHCWFKAVKAAIEDQAENGSFTVDGEMLISHQDKDETFMVMADKLDDATLQDWMINTDVTLALLTAAIRIPDHAVTYVKRIREVLGQEILEKNKAEIERLFAQNAKQNATDQHWDLQIDQMRGE
ncbi:MAG: hypothetical protein ACO24D_13860 [bacterium]